MSEALQQRSAVAPPRLLLLILIAIVAAAAAIYLPSNDPYTRLKTWSDQQLFVSAVTRTLADGTVPPEARTMVGPAYVASAIALQKVLGVNAESGLVALNRLAFFGTLLIVSVMATRGVSTWREMGQALLPLGVVWAALLLSVWFQTSTIPWTHFVVALFLVSAFASLDFDRVPIFARAATFSFFLAMTWQTRSFEGEVACIAVILLLPLFFLRNRPKLATALVAACGAALGVPVAAAFIYSLTKSLYLYTEYSDTGPSLSIHAATALDKAIQLFVDPCYHALCGAGSYPRTDLLPMDDFSIWGAPITVQLPGLVASAAALAALWIFAPKLLWTRPLPLLAAVTAGGIILGYLIAAPTGSGLLKYGIFREFASALALLLLAFVLLARPSGALSARSRTAAAGVFTLLMLLLLLARPLGLPTLEAGHLAAVDLTSSCAAGKCSFAMSATRPDGQAVALDDFSLLTATCSDGTRQWADSLHRVTVDPGQCTSISILPFDLGVATTPAGDALVKRTLDLSLPSATVHLP